jgi:hypothetical protein
MPAYFSDLNLDQIVNAAAEKKAEYHCKPLYLTPLKNASAVRYRQAVMQDLENPELAEKTASFSTALSIIGTTLKSLHTGYSPLLDLGEYLEQADAYCRAVDDYQKFLTAFSLHSEGFQNARSYLTSYTAAEHYRDLVRDITALKHAVTKIRYCMYIKNSTVSVQKYSGQSDYTAAVLKSFEKFRQYPAKDYTKVIEDTYYAKYVEEAILSRVAKLYPDEFTQLEEFVKNHPKFPDPQIMSFSRDVMFYISWLEYIRPLINAGCIFCYPELTEENDTRCIGGFDTVLAAKLAAEGKIPVVNDFSLSGQERIFVVTGPNQGGKTTFARMVGQIHYLASLGVKIPASSAKLSLCDQIFTHFEHEEQIGDLTGKLNDELIRIHDILKSATPNSLIIINEIFASTSVKDAVSIGKHLMQMITTGGMRCVLVTFLQELSHYSDSVVSLVSFTEIDSPEKRTFHIVRKPADDQAYAMSIAGIHHLTYNEICRRIRP